MSLRRHFNFTIILAAFVSLTATAFCLAQEPAINPFKSSGIYGVGESVGWTVTLPQGTTPNVDYTYTIRKNNYDVIKTGKLDLSKGRDTVEVTLPEPTMVYVQISTTGRPGTQPSGMIALGAAVAPEKLEPSVPRPADFDSFWDSKIKMLEAIPENAVLTPSDSGLADVEYSTIKMDHINGTHVYGQLAKPKREGKFPALVIFQWASPPYPLQEKWVTDRAAEGWLTLNIEPHDVLPDQPPSYYSALPEGLKQYQTIGRDDRDKNYFLQMYLADYRAVEYMAARPDWDGRTMVVMGTSMGGQQSLSVAGLNPKITHLIVNEPAGCDSNGSLRRRASGYPNWPPDNPKIMQTALYFDTVNFASRIKAGALVAMGFVDTVAPPVGIWIAFNQIKGPKEAAPMIDSPHNNMATPAQQRPYTSRSAEWLNALVHGEELKPSLEQMSDQNDQGAKSTPSPQSGVERDVKFERAAAARYRRIGALLPPEAKRKLAAASRAVLNSLAKNSNSGDPLLLARAQVETQFVGLSEHQSDVLSFYILDDVAQLLAVQDDLKRKLDDMNEMSEMTSLRLQMMMDRRSKFISTLSNIMKKISTTQDTQVQNLK